MTDLFNPDLHDFASVRHYLYGLKHHGARFGIDRMRLLSERLGHPERSFPVVHVAGTNGKGSVAAMMEAALRACGLRTGLFTSPHLVRQGERVQVDRRILGEDEIVRHVRELQPVAAELGRRDLDDHPSFFEFMTAIAFLQFQRSAVDVAIIEVGMGGRLDATNIVEPEVSIITSIGHDHMEILGDTLEKIAAEKAGIVKPGKPVVLGRLPAGAEAVVREVAASRGCAVDSVVERFGHELEAYPETNLAGGFQRVNAATAVLALRRLRGRFDLPEERIGRALLAVDWPGRWQRLRFGRREIILDAAHNREGAECLEENLAHLVSTTGRRPHLVLGVLGVPRAEALVPTAARHARSLTFVTVPHQPRASTAEALRAFVPADFAGPVACGALDALFPSPGRCTIGGDDATVVVTGSIYLLGEVMDRLFNERLVGQGTLQD